jgi:hypothetical protein
MKKALTVLLLLCLTSAAPAQQKEAGHVPYKYSIDDLANGLRHYTPEQRDLILKKSGADSNASTNSDWTTELRHVFKRRSRAGHETRSGSISAA